jgi:predicted nucleotidyltransferase
MIDLSTADLAAIQRILAQHVPGCTVRAFGSRVRGHARPYSDLDLVVIGPQPLDWRQIEALKDAFAESDLPVLVDVVDWHALSEGFRTLIAQTSVVLQEPSAEGPRAPDAMDGSCDRKNSH